MYSVIKKMIEDSMKGINANILFGTVESVNPLIVNVDQRFKLSNQFLIIPENLQQVKLVTNDEGATGSEKQREYIIRTGLEAGNKLILINLGKKYLIFDKVGDSDATIIITE